MSDNYIYNGVPWFDQNNETVNAHGACILKEENTYYLFGEYKTDDVNKYIGFSCYSSINLSDWNFEGLALPQQEDGLLGPNRIEIGRASCREGQWMLVVVHWWDDKYIAARRVQ